MRVYSEYNPIVVFVYFMTVTGLAMFIMNPVILAISLLNAVICFLVTSDGRKSTSGLMFVLMFVVLALLNPLFHHNGKTVLFLINDNPITMEAFVYGVTAATMVISVIYWFRSFSLVMTGDKLIYVFGRFSPKLSLMFYMTLRLIPLYARQAKRIKDARRAVGAYEGDNLWAEIKNGIKIFISLAGWSLENGIVTADSMEARGYGSGHRTSFARYVFDKRDFAALTLILILGTVVVLGKATDVLSFTFYPEMKEIPLSLHAVSAYISYFVLTVLFWTNEIAERRKWKYLRSKI